MPGEEPQRRYSSAFDLAEDLEHWLKQSRSTRSEVDFSHTPANGCDAIPAPPCYSVASRPRRFSGWYFTLLRSPSEKAPIEKPTTKDLTAYNLYQRAQVLFKDSSGPIKRREKLPQAARVLDELSPATHASCSPRAALQGAFRCLLGWNRPTSARLDLAKAAAQTALRLQPDAGEAHLALADYYYHGFEDYDRARTELAIARRKLPNNATVFEDMVTSTAARAIGKKPRATWSAPLSCWTSTARTTLCSFRN